MQPTRDHYRDFFAQQEATHAFTFKPNKPGRPKALLPCRVMPETGEVFTIHAAPAARHLMSPTVATDRLAALFGRVMTYINRSLLGSHYHRPAFAHRRVSAIAVCEGLPFEGHLHGILNAPEALWPRLAAIFPDKRDRSAEGSQQPHRDPWSTIAPGGTSVVKPLLDPAGWAHYVTKEAVLPDFASKILFYPSHK